MEKYIGTKLIEAAPAFRMTNGKIVPKDADFHEDLIPERDGYMVRYPDGYTSFSPKEVFEAAYLRVENNPEAQSSAPSISEKMVNDFILETWTTTLGKKTTVVRAQLVNGFEIVEASSCVSAENYSKEIGREICMRKIRDKVWELLGFLLQTAAHGIKA